MHPSRIFDKPMGFYENPPPPLQVVGLLPGYEQGQAYEGRLDIINAIGDCTVELLDNNLPEGTTVRVDNGMAKVVIAWPAFSPPVEREIINPDFSTGDLTGWNDLRGNSWGVEDYADLRGTPPELTAVMRGVGRGDHVLESIKYPVVPGTPIMSRSLWDQGPSNKDNNNLWTAFSFYRANGSKIEPNPWYQWHGDRIHDRTNKSRHWSTANVIVPVDALHATVLLIAHRRNGRNRWIAVNSVQTSGLVYSTGVQNGDDFYLTIRVRDSANRVAYWTGGIFWRSLWLSGSTYPPLLIDHIGVSGYFVSAQTRGAYFVHDTQPAENITVSGYFVSAQTKDLQWQHEQPPENIVVSGYFVSALSKSAFVVHGTQAPENILVSGYFVGASSKVVLVNTSMPTENVIVSGYFVGASTS